MTAEPRASRRPSRERPARGRRSLAAGLVAVGLAACAQSPDPASPYPVDAEPAWSPDGTQILFTRFFDGGRSDLFLISAGGGGLRRITDRPGHDQTGGWMADGRRLLFCSDRDGEEGKLDVLVMSLDGSGVDNLTHHPADDCEYALSRAGDRIAFHSDRDGDHNIFVMAATGSSLRRLTGTPGYDHVATGAWGPGDRSLVFSSNGPQPFVAGGRGHRYDSLGLYLFDPDRVDPPRPLLDLPGEDSYPTWAPDGREILFAHKASQDADDASGYDVYRVTPDGREFGPFLGGPGDQFSAAWSPDGLRVAYVSSGCIWIADRNGGGGRQLTHPSEPGGS